MGLRWPPWPCTGRMGFKISHWGDSANGSIRPFIVVYLASHIEQYDYNARHRHFAGLPRHSWDGATSFFRLPL